MKKTLSIVSIMVGFLLFSGSAWAYAEGTTNSFSGMGAGHSNNGNFNRNTFIGANAGYSATTGQHNILC